MQDQIRKMLEKAYPAYSHIIREFPEVEPLVPREVSVPEAVLRVVIGQMLSKAAARTIYDRVCSMAEITGTEPWRLGARQLRTCGLSNAKCRTINEFRDRYLGNREAYEQWQHLGQDELQADIVSHWGMSDWTAEILSLFYFGHEDVFPKGDGSLKRAMEAMHIKVNTDGAGGDPIDPDLARPYRSYLAMYLWRALDTGVV